MCQSCEVYNMCNNMCISMLYNPHHLSYLYCWCSVAVSHSFWQHECSTVQHSIRKTAGRLLNSPEQLLFDNVVFQLNLVHNIPVATESHFSVAEIGINMNSAYVTKQERSVQQQLRRGSAGASETYMCKIKWWDPRISIADIPCSVVQHEA